MVMLVIVEPVSDTPEAVRAACSIIDHSRLEVSF
jgi:hypothetical protein